MKFFIDTASLDEINEAYDMGILDGVTTNPSLIARENGSVVDIISDICSVVDGPISVEVISLDEASMLKEAKKLAEIHSNVVVKIPMTMEGLKVTRKLSEDDIATNVTLVFSPLQALMAAKSGAKYVSPFVGRLDDLSHGGINLVEQILDIYSNYDYDTEIIVASVRSPMHVLDAAVAGADIATIPLKVLKQLIQHPLTDRGISSFLEDWERSNK